jgi:hypothetical protein
MGCCIRNPGAYDNLMEEHRKKGFDDPFERIPARYLKCRPREAGLKELAVSAVAAGILIVLLLLL